VEETDKGLGKGGRDWHKRMGRVEGKKIEGGY